MGDQIHKLRAVERSDDAKAVQERTIELLSRTLAEARSGEVVNVVMLCYGRDGRWQERVSACVDKSRKLGQLFALLTGWAMHEDDA